MKKEIEGHIAIGFDKIISGLLVNAMKYLVPIWLTPLSGSVLRLFFGAISFGIIGLFVHNAPKSRDKSNVRLASETTSEAKTFALTWRIKGLMMLLGMFCVYGYFTLYFLGIQYTTPASCAIIFTLVPIWTLLMNVWLMRAESFSWQKGTGIIIGLGGALLSILSKRDEDLASNPILGDLLILGGSILFSLYLTMSSKFLKCTDSITMTKWTFWGACIPASIMLAIDGFKVPLFEGNLTEESHLKAFVVLLFVLFFATLINYLLLTAALKRLAASLVGVYQYVSVIVTMVAAVIMGQDRLNWQQIVAIIVICLGVGLSQVKSANSKNNTSIVTNKNADKSSK